MKKLITHILFLNIILFANPGNQEKVDHTFNFYIGSDAHNMFEIENKSNYTENCSLEFIYSYNDSLTSFQKAFKDYPFILYLDNLYQNMYKYSSLNTVIFENENNNLCLFSNYDFNSKKVKFSIKYNFK